MTPTLVFTFGSLTNSDTMLRRANDSISLGRASLPGFELAFSSVATVRPRPGARTWGVLWRVSADGLRRIDRFEGFPDSYDRRRVTVEWQGRQVQAWVYLFDLEDDDLASASSFYYWDIEGGFREHSAPLEALQRAQAAAIDAEYEREHPPQRCPNRLWT